MSWNGIVTYISCRSGRSDEGMEYWNFSCHSCVFDRNNLHATSLSRPCHLIILHSLVRFLQVCDGKEGINPLDMVLADWMRK